MSDNEFRGLPHYKSGDAGILFVHPARLPIFTTILETLSTYESHSYQIIRES